MNEILEYNLLIISNIRTFISSKYYCISW